MVLKTAEGISGIAEESPGVNIHGSAELLSNEIAPVAQLASGSKPTMPSCYHTRAGAFAANTCILGLLA